MVLPIKVPGHSGGEATLDRLVQEALSNAVKHRKARNVWIRVWREDLVLLCSIRGDSRGFDSSQVRASHGRKGLGLVATEEPVTAISRTLALEIESHSGYGTELSIRLPLEGGHANSDCAR